uniref:Uncharacterized protein n=1 Tax=Arundo donax TaxID=35708 RepID=A0A0A9BMI3_ARUDO
MIFQENTTKSSSWFNNSITS